MFAFRSSRFLKEGWGFRGSRKKPEIGHRGVRGCHDGREALLGVENNLTNVATTVCGLRVLGLII